MTIGPGVLTEARRFTITEPAGEYLRVDIKAAATERYRFNAPVDVTISYARCPRQHRFDRHATAWYLPNDRHERPEEMAGVIDAFQQSIAFPTTHLSTYAVAY